MLMCQRPTRIACLREVQNTIKDSVKQLLEDKIQEMGVGALFDVVDHEIRGPNGSLAIFRGLKDQNAESIKSLEGFDVAWVEEAQTMGQKSIDLLTPTIRKDGSELWFTWNPRFRTDPVDVLLRQKPPSGAVVVEANYEDNPWFPAALREDLERDRVEDEDKFNHVWMGGYLAASSMQFIPGPIVQDARAREEAHFPGDEKVMGVDVARFGDDETVICFRVGRDARSYPWEVLRKLDTMQVAAKVAEAFARFEPDQLFVDEGGLGAGVVDRLRQLSIPVIGVNSASRADGRVEDIKVANKRAEMWSKMRHWLRGAMIPDNSIMDAHLTGIEYKFDSNNAILLEKKEDMKKRGLPSPDRADALALTFAYPVVTRAMREAMPDMIPTAPQTAPGGNYNPYRR